ncbi:MAG: hypothetical protein ABJA78_12840 [Ferruginibacter sp.]
MKILYSIVLLGTIALSSCSKIHPEATLVGTWKLDDVVKKKFFDNDHVNTGYEAGLFSFYADGRAAYNGGGLAMTGNWNMHYEDRGSYNSDGEYQSDNYLVLRITLGDLSANQFLTWEFDETDFKRSSDRMDGFMHYATYSYQYVFIRQ